MSSLTLKFLKIAVGVAALAAAHAWLRATSGVLSYVVVTAMAVTLVLMIRNVGEITLAQFGVSRELAVFGRLALAVAVFMSVLSLFEVALQITARFKTSQDRTTLLNAVAMPIEWERRPAQVDGAAWAYYWHGILHSHNKLGMRRTTEFPPKIPSTFRIIAIGDSITYGYGVSSEDNYPSVLERELTKTFHIEVLNLGISGAQSEDIYHTLQKYQPILKPDLVFYGMCLNDFLPSGVGEYQNNQAYSIPVPYKDHFIKNTVSGKLIDRQYDNLLMRLGLRADFFTDILRDFGNYQTRFARDVKAIADFARTQGLPPIVTMVLNQYPTTKGQSYEIVQAAERHLRQAGMRMIPSEYIRLHDGAGDWYVSQWEGHPNEKAHRVFAAEIARVVQELPELLPYRR